MYNVIHIIVESKFNILRQQIFFLTIMLGIRFSKSNLGVLIDIARVLYFAFKQMILYLSHLSAYTAHIKIYHVTIQFIYHLTIKHKNLLLESSRKLSTVFDRYSIFCALEFIISRNLKLVSNVYL